MRLTVAIFCIAVAGCEQTPPVGSHLARDCGNVYAKVYISPHGSRWLQYADDKTIQIANDVRLDDVCTAPK